LLRSHSEVGAKRFLRRHGYHASETVINRW
jgi:hypothetical protein